MSNIKIFHHNDLDGYAAAAVIYYERYNIDIHIDLDFIELNHGSNDKDKLESVQEDDIVWIVDYSFSESTLPVLKYVLNKARKVYWIDHHITSINLVKKYPELVKVDGLVLSDISGAALTYMFVNRLRPENYEELPGFLILISDYDCWQKRYSQSNFFALGMKVTNIADIFSSTYSTLFKNKSDISSTTVQTIIERGLTVKRYLDEKYKQVCQEFGYESSIEGVKCYCVNSTGNSWVFGKLIDNYPMCALYTYNGKSESYTISLYTNESSDVDCSKIAEKFGGGGHPKAAGFTCNKLPFTKIQKLKY